VKFGIRCTLEDLSTYISQVRLADTPFMRLSRFEMVRRRRRDELHARDEAASRPNQALQPTAQAASFFSMFGAVSVSSTAATRVPLSRG
jgi:hypothetical protein